MAQPTTRNKHLERMEAAMKNQKPEKKSSRKDETRSLPNTNYFKVSKELNGKNDSGPDPEVHGQELPPQGQPS